MQKTLVLQSLHVPNLINQNTNEVSLVKCSTENGISVVKGIFSNRKYETKSVAFGCNVREK